MNAGSPSDGPGPPAPRSPFSDPRAWMLLVPVVFGTGMILAGGAWLIAVRGTSGAASGATVTVTFDSACAADTMRDRLLDYGIPGEWQGADLTLTLPGMPGDDLVPAALTAPGKLELAADGAPVPYTLIEGGVQINITGTPVSLFTMKKDLPQTGLSAKLDGVEVEVESVNGNELMLAARGKDSTEALRFATDRVVQVRHPLPCAVSVLDVKPAS
ncbi:hypothetical protein LBMAG42_00450 [Deltaproteobacteria bacterium]|nr:hypothetical protein LBMAG42_00450 [Deltaproteobacteria bacterium]